MILYHNQDQERVARSAKRILLEVDRLNRLANDLLDYSRGEIRLNMSMVNLEDFFSRFVQSISDRFSVKNIKVHPEILVHDPVIMDEERMMRVFSNLATNARKAMPRGGKFSIKVFERDRYLVFEIADTGVGMSEEVQKRVFEPFFSFSKGGGTGLGMSIVKSIVEAHEGSLSVTSKEGEGTVYTVLLPKIA
jgi:signal transduction histidine kinase